MSFPTTAFAVAAVIVLAVPGLVFDWVRRWAAGERAGDRDISLSITRGIVFSVTLAAIYVALMGPLIMTAFVTAPDGSVLVERPRLAGVMVLILFLIVPFAISLFAHRRFIDWTAPRRGPRWLRWPRPKSGRDNTVPAAWDFAMTENQGCWIRVTRADGTHVAGWFTQGSFATVYPELPSLYIKHQYQVGEDGVIGEPIAGQGFWIQITATDVVEWITPSEDEDKDK